MKRFLVLSLLVSAVAQAKPTIPPEIISCRAKGSAVSFSIHAVSRQSDNAVGVIRIPDAGTGVDLIRLACVRTDEGTGFGDQIIDHYSCIQGFNPNFIDDVLEEAYRVEVVSGGLIGRLRATIYSGKSTVAPMIPCKEISK